MTKEVAKAVIQMNRVSAGLSNRGAMKFLNPDVVRAATSLGDPFAFQHHQNHWVHLESAHRSAMAVLATAVEGQTMALLFDESKFDDSRALISVHLRTFYTVIHLSFVLEGDSPWNSVSAYEVVKDTIGRLGVSGTAFVQGVGDNTK